MKKISVILPVLEAGTKWEDCLHSIVHQTYKQIEILLLYDKTDELLNENIEFQKNNHENVTTYHIDRSKGVGVARNVGIEHASGDYLYFVHSDDYLNCNTLEELIHNIEESPMIKGKIVNPAKHPHTNELEGELYQEGTVSQFQDIDKLFQDRTILHCLIAKSFIDEYNLRFSEVVQAYTDFSFIVPIMLKVKQIPVANKAIYYRRSTLTYKRSAGEAIEDFLKQYHSLKRETKANQKAANYLDRHLLNYYRKTIVTHFKIGKNIDPVFPILVECMKQVDDSALADKSTILKREIKAINTNDIRKYKRVNKWHHRLRKVKWATKKRRNFYIQLYRSVFLRLPKKENIVVFESFLGKNYSDSPKYIYEQMLKQRTNYTFIWIFNEPGKSLPGNPKQVKRFSLFYYYYLARAKYWVFNARSPVHLNKPKGTVFLQTWHGTPLKRLALDMEEVHMPGTNTRKYKRNFVKETRKWDYLISPNEYSTNIFRRAFQFEHEMLEYGYPRNDVLYGKDKEQRINQLKESLHIPQHKKVILYAPTWRDDEYYEKGKYKFTLKLDLQHLQEKLGDDYVILLRMHYLIAQDLDLTSVQEFAYDVSSYEDIGELYLISDVLITDYSSVFFDYANLKRPILFYTYDLDKYKDQLRGFYIDMETEVPGPLLKTTEEVVDALVNIDSIEQQYADKYQSFYETFCSWDNGEASRCVVEKVFPLKP
ncbi:bifunctional glycosyltransferase/CDP-glycerol:glycerophosphate glycerophosphotransferase [Salirhabdus salicampi]|uniref:bifunctional glycosyltransferase/CDP-glycerol:glycerophosphate glycerophosphotransferase n=1 Tax=Salirhabdus salicampi TaxID=476102 RepID=UPI0020C36481|nr:CDP-glycerol glycerophosphotransferase family protein [Salirhabdus salicampi]MCP8617483.1 CDP-glycerol glycerophosphotransferase family protein [Salirhabdus salicampi]